ncbi:glycosyltransferase family 2 protein [Lewinella sp. IMCC34183]|uniref:glycosyltransferase family 2 protein n=1 Tax=Lewinella sp. IMCC34183 TaxID=2248762 RepID=UPI000E242A08|nr:glycosyltransferase family 2 protein [Lewinella sp. IMCC34183]
MPPLFTVVIPTHDRPDLLLRAVASVKAQRFGDWEVIVVDDCSEQPVSLASVSGGDTRVRLVTNRTNMGPGASRHIGAELATGRFLCFLDDDDYYLPHYLTELAEYLELQTGQLALTVTAMLTEMPNGERRLGGKYDEQRDVLRQYWEQPVSLLPFVIPATVARRWPPSSIPSPIEDFEWLCTLLSQVGCSTLGIAGVVYVTHPENRTVTLTRRRDLLAREAVLMRLASHSAINRRIKSQSYTDKLIHQRLHWTRQCIRQRQWKNAGWGLSRSINLGSLNRVREWTYTLSVLLRTLLRIEV